MSDTQGPGDSVVFSVRVPVDVAAKILGAAKAEKLTRNAWVRQVLIERLEGQPRPDKVTVRPIETVESDALSEPQDVRAKIDVDAHAIVVCSHPKNKRVNLGYSVKCGVCGEVLR